MTTITTPGSNEAVALLYEGAARELQLNGLCTGRMKRPDGSLCLFGALAQAAGVGVDDNYDVDTNPLPAGWEEAMYGVGPTHTRAIRLLRDGGYTQWWSDVTARVAGLDPIDHVHLLKTAAEAVRAGEQIPHDA